MTFPLSSSGSMKVYGSLATQAMAMYPAALAFEYATRVIQFIGDQEQRFLVHGELFSATLQFSRVNGYDTSVIRDFFRTVGGMLTSTDLSHTFDITIDSVQYSYCVFDQDTFEVEVDREETFSFELRLKQLRPN